MCYTNIKFSFFAIKSIVLLFLFVNYAIYTTSSDSTSSFSRPILQSQNSHKHFLYKTQCPLMHMTAEEEYVAHIYMYKHFHSINRKVFLFMDDSTPVFFVYSCVFLHFCWQWLCGDFKLFRGYVSSNPCCSLSLFLGIGFNL